MTGLAALPTRRARALLLAVAASGLFPTGAVAQFDQYATPADLEPRRESMAELLARAIEESRWRLGRLEIGVGAEDSAVEFDAPDRDRSNSGTSPILELDLESPVLYLSTKLAARDLEPAPGSLFPAYDEVTGSFLIASRPTGRSEIQLFADRNLVYALDPRWAYFQDTYYGAGLVLSLGSAASLRVYGGRGVDEYTAYDAGGDLREDDFDTLGADLRFLPGRVQLRIGVGKTDYDSNLPDFDRSVTIWSSGLVLGGGSGSPWG